MLRRFKYYNPQLKVAFNNWREVYLVQESPVLLLAEVHRSCLVYRIPKTNKRISYNSIKQHLLKQDIELYFEILPVYKTDWLC
jgi:hypothetical protein